MNKSKQFFLATMIAFGIFSVAILGLEVWGYVMMSDLQSQIAETIYRTSKVADQANILASLSKNLAKAQKYDAFVNTALPDQKDASALTSDLDSLATSSGLKLTVVQSNSYNKSKTATSDLSLLQTIRGKYSYELPLSIEVKGPYNGFVNFVQKLENYQRLVNITAVDIEKSQEKDAPADQIVVKLNLTAYLK